MDKAEPAPDLSLGQEKFKKGDYSVHVFLEESKGLLPTTDDRNFNPVISVKCFDKVKCTRKLKDVTSGATSIWNEHLYFSKLSCTVMELEASKILIEVIDSRSLKSNLIGSYELDFTYVYFQPKHSIIHQWIILSNPYSEDITVQRGLIKVGVNIMHESDKGEDLTIKGHAESMIIPPQVNVKSMQLVVKIMLARNLPKMDSGGTCDAYCQVTFATSKNKSKVITADKGTMSAEWYEELLLPVCQPNISNKVSLTVWDHDTFGEDELIGSLNFHWDKIPTKEEYLKSEFPYFWANIYGAPEGITNEKAVEMNYNQKIASHSRGMVLLSMYKEEVDKAVFKNIDFTQKEKELLSEYEAEDYNLEINMQVLEAVNLPNKTGQYKVKIVFFDVKNETKPIDATQGCCKWYEKMKKGVALVPKGFNTLPDIFVYLVYDDQDICFTRIKVEDVSNPWPKETWFKLTPDSAIGKVANIWEGGYLLLRLAVLKQNDPNLNKSLWAAKIDYSQKISKKLLVCNLYQCRNLPSADATGLADPYIKVLCGSSEYITDKKPSLEF